MLAFLRLHPTRREDPERQLASALRLSAKRLRMIADQRQEIERLQDMNARLATLVIALRAEQGLPIDDALRTLIVPA